MTSRNRAVNMLDLAAEYDLFADEIREAIDAVLQSRQYINGPAVAGLEDAMRDRMGVRHAVAVSSGTDALLCSLMALRIGPGDEVIVPTFTFFATAGVIARVGAVPVFVDVDERTFNVSVDSIENVLTDKTRAIIAVHLFGQCADMQAINSIADRHDVRVIEDAAQAIDASCHGHRATTFGDLATLSFYPTKNLGGFGEGGMVLTNDDDLAASARRLRNHGESDRYRHETVGGNFRLDSIKAAILLVKLKYLDRFTAARRRNAARYDELLAGAVSGSAAGVTQPYVPPGHEPVYHQYTIQSDHRDELRSFLADRGVGSGVYYPMPLHRQPCFASLGYAEGSLPVAERLCDRVLSLPCHPMLTDEDLQAVAACVQEFVPSRPLSGGASPGVEQTRCA